MTRARQRECRSRWLTSFASLCSLSKLTDTLEQAGRFPGWRLHPLKGELAGFWNLTVTGNRRLIFRYNEKTNTASDIDLTDYH
jgi:proteic killer suppression protein